MRWRYPEQKGRNLIRLLPLLFLILSLPFAAMMVYEYFVGLNTDAIRPIIAIVFVLYFAYRARFAIQVTFIKDEEK